MTIKDRLLEALRANEFDWSRLSEGALLDVVLEELRDTKAALFEAQAALLKEGMRADELGRTCQRELHELRTNPLATAQGDFYFADISGSAVYIVSIRAARATLMRRQGRIDYCMQQISVGEYARLVVSQ
jgi:hypothetical protein